MDTARGAESGSHTVRLRIRIHGRVQGVFFRAKAQDQAEALSITGFARNEPDGTVMIECEGSPEAIEHMRSWCESGPPEAHVERIDTVPLEPIGGTGFRRL